jgi:hypothetical protein
MTDMTLNELRSHTLDKIGAVLEDKSAEHKLATIEEIHRDHVSQIDGCLFHQVKEEWGNHRCWGRPEANIAKGIADQFRDPPAAYKALLVQAKTQPQADTPEEVPYRQNWIVRLLDAGDRKDDVVEEVLNERNWVDNNAVAKCVLEGGWWDMVPEFWANNLIKRLEALGAKVKAQGFESTFEAGLFLQLEELFEART